MAEQAPNPHADQHWAYTVITNDLGWCGCGDPERDLELVLSTLELAPLYEDEGWRRVPELLGPAHEIVLYLLDHAGLMEHGGTVGGAWLTDKGKRFLVVCRSAGELGTLFEVGYECSDCPGPALPRSV